jgi:hypothetical protein
VSKLKSDPRCKQIRKDIELGWRQSQDGLAVDGAAMFAEIRTLGKRRGKIRLRFNTHQ